MRFAMVCRETPRASAASSWALGVFCVVAFSTARRLREFGVRMALGAERRSILASAGGGVTLPALWRIAAGVVLAALLVPLTGSLFYDVQGLAPPVAGTSVTALGIIAPVATWLPARRALRTDPLQALRAE